jgi:cholesterol transport system auxiliary component
MKRPAYQRYWLGLLVAFSTAGCVSVSVERQFAARRYFVLDVAGDHAPAMSNAVGVLKISNVRVSPRYDSKGFVYRTADTSYETDFYHQFLVPPGPMLTDEVQQALSRADIFQYVVNSASQLEPTHVLEGTADALYGDFSDPTSAQAVLTMSFLLSRAGSNGPEVILQKHYRKAVPVQSRTAAALVKGWNEALEAILASLVADLKTAK